MRSVDLDHTITAGTTPTMTELRELALRGYRTIVDLRMGDEVGPMSLTDEQEAARMLRMDFLNIGIPARTVSAERLDVFRREVAGARKPAYGHCTCGGRAVVCSAVHLGLEVDEAEDAIMRRMRLGNLLQEPDLYEGRIRAYVQSAQGPYARLAQVIW